MMKYVFVTGGVVSSLGKGTTAASLGRLLKARGYKVAMQKCDTYYNFNPALLSPLQHGENFITEDGVAADLDLGHYERFIDESLKGKQASPPARFTLPWWSASCAANTTARRLQSCRM